MMKILYNGCSWTYGDELEDKKERFSYLVSQHFNAEEVNVAECGSSNDKITRTTYLALKEHKDIDAVVIQWSNVERAELWDKKHYPYNMIPSMNLGGVRKRPERLEYVTRQKCYYGTFEDATGHEMLYKNIHLMQLMCKDYGVPLYMTKLKPDKCKESKRGWEFVPMTAIYEKLLPDYSYRMPKGHPTPEGHQIIAQHIIELMT